PRLKGEATRTAAAIYATLGLAVPDAGSLPEDHLAFELDAVLAFHEVFRRSGAGAESPELVALWGYFLFDHLARWVPLFLSRIRQAQDVPAEIRRAASLLAAWLSAETGETGESPTRPAPTMHQPGGTA
ncbi:TorD-like chaperone, partial [Desulfovibrio sp. X2]|uniref:molecular chaperone TorD family protein n=1 Tax=Desulfovibrio sp. X2 TaxID=941449 RepID=UPI00035889CB